MWLVSILRAEKFLALTLYRNLEEIPFNVDLAVLLIPPRFIPEALRECARKGVKGVVISAEGFAETGPEGARYQEEVKRYLKINRHERVWAQYPGPGQYGNQTDDVLFYQCPDADARVCWICCAVGDFCGGTFTIFELHSMDFISPKELVWEIKWM
ncbi:MAG: CoA-binding protein [Anaerotruncus sp.]|nr:CoA-binding protein [Anaerotruncus sp.]